jgi:hypothetical protein
LSASLIEATKMYVLSKRQWFLRLGCPRQRRAAGIPAPLQSAASLVHSLGREVPIEQEMALGTRLGHTPPIWQFSPRPAVSLSWCTPLPHAGLFSGVPSPRRPARPEGSPEASPPRTANRRGGHRHPMAPVPTDAGPQLRGRGFPKGGYTTATSCKGLGMRPMPGLLLSASSLECSFPRRHTVDMQRSPGKLCQPFRAELP